MNDIGKSNANYLDYCKQYAKTVRMTVGCRFEAARRLKAKDSGSSAAIAIISVYPIALSLTDLVPALKSLNFAQYIPFVASVASIVILVLSLLAYAQQYSVRGAQMQQCGQELSEIYYDLEMRIAAGSVTPEHLQLLKTSYDKIIAKYPENHSQIDFHYYRATHVRSIKDKGISGYSYIAWNRMTHVLDRIGVYIVAIIGPPVIFILMVRSNS